MGNKIENVQEVRITYKDGSFEVFGGFNVTMLKVDTSTKKTPGSDQTYYTLTLRKESDGSAATTSTK